MNVNSDLEIYIHIPFCVQKCRYCDFLSGPFDENIKSRYLEKLCHEIETFETKRSFNVKTVFFGGGTPSVLNSQQISDIMASLKKRFGSDILNAEITIESNPGTLNKEKLAAYRSAGINRLSIGLQSADNTELRLLGRIHTYEEFVENFNTAREVGFNNINIDMIAAVPYQSKEKFLQSLKKVIELKPEHMSVYSLILEEGTPFYEEYGNSENTGIFLNEDEERELYYETELYLKQAGYHRYEISNYAKEGYECEHNKGYWMRQNYIGFGLGAASLLDNIRFTKPDNFDEYFAGNDEVDMRRNVEILDNQSCREEFMFLGLRMTEGISIKKYIDTFGISLLEIYSKQLAGLKELSAIEICGDRIRLTDYGRDVSNVVLAEFLE